jgi:hypothetical protein
MARIFYHAVPPDWRREQKYHFLDTHEEVNRRDAAQYIVRLIAQVITVSLETAKSVKALPPLP